MAKKVLMVVVIMSLAAGIVSAQVGFKEMAKNTVTVDFFPLIEGLAIGAVGDMISGDSGGSTSGFGLAAQYERQLAQKFSVAARFSYLGGGVGYSDKYTDTSQVPPIETSTSLGINISSFAAEAHARFYPFGKTFFLDGMLGYANMTVKLSGKIVGKATDSSGNEYKDAYSADMDIPKDFFTLGAKFGWRISLGKNGGFTIEPALGYKYGITAGETFGKQLSKKIEDKFGAGTGLGKDTTDQIDQLFGIIQDFVFVGGPYITLAFGWRF